MPPILLLTLVILLYILQLVTGAMRLLLPGSDSRCPWVLMHWTQGEEIEMILAIKAVMLEDGGHASYQCLPETVVSTSSKLFTLVKNTNNQLQYKLYWESSKDCRKEPFQEHRNLNPDGRGSHNKTVVGLSHVWSTQAHYCRLFTKFIKYLEDTLSTSVEFPAKTGNSVETPKSSCCLLMAS